MCSVCDLQWEAGVGGSGYVHSPMQTCVLQGGLVLLHKFGTSTLRPLCREPLPTEFVDDYTFVHRATEQGDAIAQYNLGAYHNGLETAKNRVEAVNWFRKVAE